MFLKRVRRKISDTVISPIYRGSRYPSRNLRVARPLPRTLWLYWAQGVSSAPGLVQACIKTWEDMNPEWKLHHLDAATAGKYVDTTDLPAGISHAHRADIIRIRLLSKYGGVWADATCLCSKPLESWLPPLMQSGFFAFTQPSRDRILSNWFLASEKNGYIANVFSKEVTKYWRGRKKADNYFWFHHLFEWQTHRDKTFRNLWRATPQVSADGPHLAQRYLTGKRTNPKITDAGILEAIPVHKLDWKADIKMDDMIEIGLLPRTCAKSN